MQKHLWPPLIGFPINWCAKTFQDCDLEAKRRAIEQAKEEASLKTLLIHLHLQYYSLPLIMFVAYLQLKRRQVSSFELICLLRKTIQTCLMKSIDMWWNVYSWNWFKNALSIHTYFHALNIIAVDNWKRRRSFEYIYLSNKTTQTSCLWNLLIWDDKFYSWNRFKNALSIHK